MDSVLPGKHLDLCGADVGRADEQPDRLLAADQIEIDRLFEQAFERIDVERIELIRRRHEGERLHEQKAGRMFQPVFRAQPVDQGRLEDAAPGFRGEPVPERTQRGFCAIAAACRQARGKDYGVDRTGAAGRDSVERKPLVFQQPVEHAPGERAMRAAPLERQVDDFLA